MAESQTQYTRTKQLYDSTSAQLEQFHRFQEELKAFKKNALMLRDVVEARTAEASALMEEKESLQGMFEEIKDELERRKIQVCFYLSDHQFDGTQYSYAWCHVLCTVIIFNQLQKGASMYEGL